DARNEYHGAVEIVFNHGPGDGLCGQKRAAQVDVKYDVPRFHGQVETWRRVPNTGRRDEQRRHAYLVDGLGKRRVDGNGIRDIAYHAGTIVDTPVDDLSAFFLQPSYRC